MGDSRGQPGVTRHGLPRGSGPAHLNLVGGEAGKLALDPPPLHRAAIDPIAADASVVRDAEDPLEVAEDLYRSSEPPPAAATESLVAQAWSHRPELAALRHAAAAQGSLAAAEWGGALPTLDGAAKLVYGQPNPYYVPPNDDFEATWLVAAVVEWSPDGAWAAGRRAEAAEAEQRALLADLEDVRDGVRIEVSDLAARLRASHRVLEAAEAGLKAAEAGHAAIQRAFELGASDATEVIDTQLQLQRARLGRVDAAVERRWLEVRLAEAIGARRAALAK